MSPVYEFEGKTKDGAVSKACEELGISEDELEIEVISFGSTGIFGLVGAKKAKIKVTVPETPEVRMEELPPAAEEELPPAAEEEPPPAAEEGLPPAAEEDEEEVADIAKATLEKIVSFIVDDATVTVEIKPDIVGLKVEGGNSALLIGKHGRTLDALQYIVQRIVQKKKRTRLRFSIDVEGYRDRRKASLTQLALRLGDKVKRSGKSATISPMNAYDRRVVHVALKDNAEVRTQSMGAGSLRKLVIYPQRKQR
jgi:spoIIIJ-associated protein